MLDDHHDIRAVLAQTVALWPAIPGAPDEQSVHFAAARRVGAGARGRDGLESDLAHGPGARLRKCQNRSASEYLGLGLEKANEFGDRRRALADDAPAARSGGSSSRRTMTRDSASVTGLTSSGFFFAAMMPLSEGAALG